MGQAAKLIEVARKEIGIREGRSTSGSWNNRVKYNDWYVTSGAGEVFRAVAWCAIFVSWCARVAGIPESIIPKHAYTPSGWNWFKARGRAVSSPQSGDLMYVYYPKQGRIGHVGIVERRDGDYVITIEGNTNTSGSSQGNGVYRLRRRITSNLKFVRPAYAAAPAAPAPPKAAPKPAGPRLVNTVSISHLKAARYQDPPKQGTPRGAYADEVFTLETALNKTEWLKRGDVDGHYGTSTVGDGSSGYGGVTGFQKKHTGTKNPDGWMGRQELTKLFRLAGMNVKITD